MQSRDGLCGETPRRINVHNFVTSQGRGCRDSWIVADATENDYTK